MVQEGSNRELRVSFPCPYLFMSSWIKGDVPSQALPAQEEAVSTQGHQHTAQVGQQGAGQGHCSLDNILQPGRQLCREGREKPAATGKVLNQPFCGLTAYLWALLLLFMGTSEMWLVTFFFLYIMGNMEFSRVRFPHCTSTLRNPNLKRLSICL